MSKGEGFKETEQKRLCVCNVYLLDMLFDITEVKTDYKSMKLQRERERVRM